MARRDTIVIGCSLGGVQALPNLVSKLPAELEASVFIVMHMSQNGPNHLPNMLHNAALTVKSARDGEPIRPRTIYVAVPDRHLLLDGDRVRLSRGPKESHARPSVDALFRSAAVAAGPRVIGVVLTGNLDDGTSGLWSIKDRGGIAIVQSPDQAAYPSMPLSALQHADIDYTLRLEEIPNELLRLTQPDLPHRGSTPMVEKKLETEVKIAAESDALNASRTLGEASFFTCPECHGSMVKIAEGTIERYRCHTGHAFSERALAECGPQQAERTLWAAFAQFEEHLALLKHLEHKAAGREENKAKISKRTRDMEDLVQQVRALVRHEALSNTGTDDLARNESVRPGTHGLA